MKIFYSRQEAQLTRQLMLLPTVILLVLCISFSFVAKYYIQQKDNNTNQESINLASSYLRGVIEEMFSLKYPFVNNISLSHTMKIVLGNKSISYDDRIIYKSVQNTLLAQMYAKGYIESFYLYYNNEAHRFFVSDVLHNRDLLTSVSSYYDTEWYNDYMSGIIDSGLRSFIRELPSTSDVLEQARSVLTLYNLLNTVENSRSVGLLTINLNLDYLQTRITEILNHSQQIFIYNEYFEPLFSTGTQLVSDETAFSSLKDADGSRNRLQLDNVDYMVYSCEDPDYHWHYIMITPASEQLALIALPLFFINLTAFIAIFILFLRVRSFARQNNFLIQDVENVLRSAEENKMLSSLPQSKTETDRIIRQTLVDFIENKYYAVSSKEHQYHMQVLELLMLQNQMNPHFLFNTMHSINWKAIALTNSENDVSSMIENLSVILRFSLKEPLQPVTLKEEIEVANSYLEIENKRFGNRFEAVEWKTSVELDKYQVPKLIIQPLIENCILHAFPQRRNNCRIRIRILVRNDKLLIRITDNGIGISATDLQVLKENLRTCDITNSSQHAGLLNTYSRLKLLYPLDASMHIVSINNLGTSVRLTIPANTTTTL